jgi:hypothetical protein
LEILPGGWRYFLEVGDTSWRLEILLRSIFR